MQKRRRNSRAQVWVETVIYTLIAFAMIGLVLSFVKPKIEETQDRAIIEQSIDMMKGIDSVIVEITQGGPGNKRRIELGIKKGILTIDSVGDKIVFEIQSKSEYSESGRTVQNGDIEIHTEKKGKYSIVTLTQDYSGQKDIFYQNTAQVKTLPRSSTPYILFFSNEGKNIDKTIINIDLN